MDGNGEIEHVPPETSQDAAWLESCKLAPVTLGHPAELVKKDNAGQVVIGQLGDGATFQAGRNIAPMSVTRKDGLDRLQAGTRELSCGYTCPLFAKSGEFQGQRYDAGCQTRCAKQSEAIRSLTVAVRWLAPAAPAKRRGGRSSRGRWSGLAVRRGIQIGQSAVQWRSSRARSASQTSF
jgi:hypothetical protein